MLLVLQSRRVVKLNVCKSTPIKAVLTVKVVLKLGIGKCKLCLQAPQHLCATQPHSTAQNQSWLQEGKLWCLTSSMWVILALFTFD